MPTERPMPEAGEGGTPTGGGPGRGIDINAIVDRANVRNNELQQLRQRVEERANEQALSPQQRADLYEIARRDFMNQLFPEHGVVTPVVDVTGRGQARPPGSPPPPTEAGVPQPTDEDLPEGFIHENDNVPAASRVYAHRVNQLFEQARNEVLSDPINQQIYARGSQQQKDLLNQQIVFLAGRLEAEANAAAAQRSGREETLGQRREDIKALLGIEDEDIENIPVITQSGIPEVRVWPKSPENKIKYFRLIMNDIEGNFAEESTGTHRQKQSEIFEVIPALQQNADAATKKLGGQMFEELTRRLVLHQSYMKFATASDANGAIEGVGGVYDLVQNVLLRDLDHDYYATYEAEVKDPNDDSKKIKETRPLTHNKNLKVWYAFNWYHQNAERMRNTAQDEQGNLHDELKKELQDEKRWGEGKLDEVDAESSQLIGQRMWEITLRRAIEDDLINMDTRLKYDLDNENEEIRKAEWQRLEKDAKARKVDFQGKVSGGTFYARRALLVGKWLQTQKENYRLRDGSINMVHKVDFGARDMFAHIPGDLENYLKEELVKIYKETPLTVDSNDTKWDANSKKALADHEGKNTGDPAVAAALAAEEAKVITEAILGTRKDKGGSSWAVGSDLVDFSNLAFKLEDLDAMRDAEMKKPQRNQAHINELDRRKRILEKYRYNEDVDPEKLQDSEQKANAMISQHFKDGLFDFKRVRRPAQMIPSSFKGPEDVRGVLTSKDGPLRNPRPDAIVKLGETLSYLNQGQFGRSLQLIKNYIDFERTGGLLRQTGISNEQAEILINEMGMKLEMSLDEIGQAKQDLIWSEELKWVPGYNYIRNKKDDWVKHWEAKVKAANQEGDTFKADMYENMQKLALFFGDMYPDMILFLHEARKSTITRASVLEFLEELVQGIWKEITKEKYI